MYCFGRPLIVTDPEIRAAAVEDYCNHVPLKVIAKKYGFTPATISIWAKAANVKRRARGIQPTDCPSDRDRAIIRRSREVAIKDVAKEFKMTRARVWSIRSNWKKAGWQEPLPWKVGDTIEWAGERFRVLRVDNEKRGAVRTEGGKTIDPFAWRYQGVSAKLVTACVPVRKGAIKRPVADALAA